MRSGKIESVAATASRAALGAQDGMLQGTVLAGTAASGYFSRASQRGRSLGARDGRGATYDWTVVTTRTEVLAEGRPRTLGRRRPLRHPPIEIVTDRKNAVFGERYLRMNERAVYQLGPHLRDVSTTLPAVERGLGACAGIESGVEGSPGGRVGVS
jgi:hypothetical protein